MAFISTHDFKGFAVIYETPSNCEQHAQWPQCLAENSPCLSHAGSSAAGTFLKITEGSISLHMGNASKIDGELGRGRPQAYASHLMRAVLAAACKLSSLVISHMSVMIVGHFHTLTRTHACTHAVFLPPNTFSTSLHPLCCLSV